MFMQVIQGRVVDADELRRAMDGWIAELAPGATGWVGSTAGVTEDGRFIASARFDSEEAARANSDRPEQGMWWSQTEKSLSDVVFHDCSDVTLINGGGSDRAGFVQVMQTTDSDVPKQRHFGKLGRIIDEVRHGGRAPADGRPTTTGRRSTAGSCPGRRSCRTPQRTGTCR